MSPRSPVEQIQWRLTQTNPVTWKPEIIDAELSALSDLERGRLLGPVWRDHYYSQYQEMDRFGWIVHGLEEQKRNDQKIPPIFDAEAADEALSVLVTFLDKPVPEIIHKRLRDVHWTAQDVWYWNITRDAEMICSRLIEEPGPQGRAALSILLTRIKMSNSYRILAARLAGEIEIEKGTLAELHRKAETPLAISEINAVLTAPALQWPWLFSEFLHIDHSQRMTAEPGAVSAFDLPAYREFAPEAVEFALARVRAVQSGQEPYKADKLMSRTDAYAVARALKLALAEDLSWGLDPLEEIWRGAAFAPDAKAKTLPSQTLTHQIAFTVIEEPRPRAVLLLAEIARAVRHASVHKRLSRYAKQAMTALGQRPERVLDDLAKGVLAPDLTKLVKPALEGLFLRDWDMEARVWSAQMTDASTWPTASRLIWQVGDFTAMPRRQKDRLFWVTASGAEHAFDETSRIRLWHPVEASDEERHHWRKALAEQEISQPFAQAYREIYPLNERELGGRETNMFAGHLVAQIPMIGLARRSGFTFGYYDEIDLPLGGQTFRFSSGVRNYPGAGGEGTTGEISLIGPATSFAGIPLRVFSEAMRRFDLIISVGTAGIKDRLPEPLPEHLAKLYPGTLLHPGSQSLEMRRTLLQLMRPQAKIDGRWVALGNNMRLHLGTGRIYQDGTPVEFDKKIKAGSTPRADDRVMDRIWAAIEVFGLEE